MIKSVPSLLEDFVLIHLPKELGLSKATIYSYYSAIEQYILWLRDVQGNSFESIDVSCFQKETIKEFLNYLENERHVSAATRNLRKSGILSFLCYASDIEPVYMNAYLSAKKIKNKKVPKPKRDFLTIEEYKALLESIDTGNHDGAKHSVLIQTMYETAARVAESVAMDMQDFSFGRENSVVIFGKGAKYRRVYLNNNIAKLIRDYSRSMAIEKGALFKNRSGNRMSDSGIDYIIKKYAELGAARQPSITEKQVSPHTLRRSKASHMLLNGISVPVIQRFLGHESISTTEKYLELGSKAMNDAVQKTETLIFGSEVSSHVKKWEDPNILVRLKGLLK
jgi:site-specific recombinase XerD